MFFPPLKILLSLSLLSSEPETACSLRNKARKRQQKTLRRKLQKTFSSPSLLREKFLD